MIRFVPDDWFDALMRPLDMASPEANTYVEIAAPDVRLAAALFLCALVLILWRKRAGDAKPTLRLLGLLLVSMVVWLATSGNGRYFIAWLLLLGPLCAGAISLLPASRPAKVAMAAGIVALQLFILSQNSPFASWTWVNWQEPPYFHIDKPPQEPATYVTIASISYSLVAPQFPPGSRWVGLSAGAMKRDAAMLDERLASATNLTLIAPALPSQTRPDGRPAAGAEEALGNLLKPHGLSFAGECRMLESGGMRRLILRQRAASDAAAAQAKFGFWLCPLRYRPGPVTAPPPIDPKVGELYAAVEKICPRFFSGGSAPLRINGGWVKNYDTDTKVYLLDDGSAYYKFWRSINPEKIGTADELRAGTARVDCSRIRAPNWRRGGP